MRTFTIQLNDEQQYRKLLELARQAGIDVIADGLAVPSLLDVSDLSREEKLAILRRGGSGTSTPDPLAWKREEREERDSVQKARLAAYRPLSSDAERQYHMNIIAHGGSGKSIPNPLAWQRKTRQDRPLPGRD